MKRGETLEAEAINAIIKILTADGMTFEQSADILKKVQLIMMESSKNFLDQANAREVLETPNRYSTWLTNGDADKNHVNP